jgi:hypothetical protein
MLTKLDENLIGFSQWAIRQVELFTTITRKNIINSTLILLFLVQTYLFVFHLIRFNLLVLVIVVGPFTKEAISLLIASWITERPGTLPRAINERRQTRLVILCLGIGLLAAVFVPVLLLLSRTNEGFFQPVTALILCHMMPIILAAVAEYLLCTSSLPPGEKVKRLAERELRNAVPGTA